MRNGFYAKLAAGNIKKNGKTYIPYILTCIVTVAMFYIVKSLSLNPGLSHMVGGNFLNTTMGLGSWVVTVFAFIFLFYTNSFLVKHRKKEFGIFHILGMERRHLARVIGWETFYVMIISVILGLGIGIALDKVMFLAVVRIVGADVPLGFFLAPEAVAGTVIFFSILFVLIFANSVRQIRGADPIELLRAGNVGEREPQSNWLLTIWGLAARLLYCYYHPESHCLRTVVFCGGASGDRRDLSAVHGRQYSAFEDTAQEQAVLLPHEAFCQRIRNDLPNEAKCGGTGQYLHSVYHGAGDGVYYHFHDGGDGGDHPKPLSGGLCLLCR